MAEYAKPFGRILISDLVVANLFMHSLPGMILLYLAKLFYTKSVFAWDIITFVRFMHYYKSRIFHSYITSYPGRSWSEYTSVNTLYSIDYTTCTTEFLI